MKQERILYYILLAICVVNALVLEFVPIMDGLIPSDGMAALCTEYTMVLLTLVFVYLALRLIKNSVICRMLLLACMMIANTMCYHLFMVPSFVYLSLIALAGYPFVYPGKEGKEG